LRVCKTDKKGKTTTSLVAEYKYDILGRRIEKKLNSKENDIWYNWNNWNND